MMFVFFALALFVVVVLMKWIQIVPQKQVKIIERLGKYHRTAEAGLNTIVPFLDSIRETIDLREQITKIEPQPVITRDNVTITVDAVAYFQVVDPLASVVKIQNWYTSAQLVAQTTLRSIIGRHEMDQMLSERDRINNELQLALDSQTEAWGIKVHRVEIRDVGLPEQMQRAMARQAEAERERRAKIIAAEGELQASQKLGEAADVITRSPGALQLRQLQTMTEISAENSSTIIFPIPIEIMNAISAVTNSLGGVPPVIVPPRPAPAASTETTVSDTNDLPDVEIPPSEAAPPPPPPADPAAPPYPDLPPPPTAPPPPPPPVS
jgi:regulator of protease activity HflC (stomatin/prohibitin superfamily)